MGKASVKIKELAEVGDDHKFTAPRPNSPFVHAPDSSIALTPYVLSTRCGRLGAPVRRAVSCLMSTEQIDERSAWNLCAKWILGITTKRISCTASLIDAEQWFDGEASTAPGISSVGRTTAENELKAHAHPELWGKLLPYLLDPHGPGSRISVRTAPETEVARKRKRAEGVFYTPPDVAEFMAARLLEGSCDAPTPPTVLDPACGTGAFLRAALKTLRKSSTQQPLDLVSGSLFGVDISLWALDASAYVLLHDCFDALSKTSAAPASAWNLIRKNLACADALTLDRSETHSVQQSLPIDTQSRQRQIGKLFPSLKDGPNFVLGNPPYCPIGQRPDLLLLSHQFVTLDSANVNAEIYPLFVEQMISLVSANGGGALVLPLSIANNSGRQFLACRDLIRRTPGVWQFSFFDREPHALFGEHVKTRNAIVFWQKASSAASFFTGPLRKWRGPGRAAMFRSVQFTRISSDIRCGIPKIDGHKQRAALEQLQNAKSRLSDKVRTVTRCHLADVPQHDAKHLVVGPTAYNFINAFFSNMPRAAGAPALSGSAHHLITCRSPKDARAIFAVLSSRVAFWWWHIHGDGFHVSRKFLSEFPLTPSLLSDTPNKEKLSELGKNLWARMRTSPIVSRNGGKTSFAFSPLLHDQVRDAIDALLISELRLDADLNEELDRFVRRVTTADPNAG